MVTGPDATGAIRKQAEKEIDSSALSHHRGTFNGGEGDGGAEGQVKMVLQL